MRNHIVPFTLCLFAVGCIVGHCTGCAPADTVRVENAAAVAQYDAELVICKEKAKKARDFDLYLTCEREVTLRLCMGSQGLQKEWKACKEVMP